MSRISKVFLALPAIAAAALAASGDTTFAQQDKYALVVPGGGLAFSDFRGYDTWESVAVSETKDQMKAILGNPATIKAYKSGVPDNGKAFPDGVKFVKIEWAKKTNTAAPYFVEVPGELQALAFIEKDTKRFPKTHGWAYAVFNYDPQTKTFKPQGTGADCGYACHTAAASRDYIFTAYPAR